MHRSVRTLLFAALVVVVLASAGIVSTLGFTRDLNVGRERGQQRSVAGRVPLVPDGAQLILVGTALIGLAFAVRRVA